MRDTSSVSDHTNQAGKLWSRRVTIAAIAAAVLLTGVAAVAQGSATITPESVDHWQHFIDCTEAMFQDEPDHAKYCAPGHDVFVNGGTGFTADHYATTSSR